MKRNILKYFLITLFIISPIIYHSFYFGIFDDIQKTFLTVATFLFAVLAGFFIAKQATRYSDVRGRIANFDGNMSFIYRSSEHLGHSIKEKIKKVIENHYQKILQKKSWDWYFMHKSKTLIALHDLFEKELKEQSLPTLKNVVMVQIMAAMREQQQTRKNLVALYQERIPKLQWVLMLILSLIILFSLSKISSQYDVAISLLKGIFATSLFAILVLLHQLDDLELFEKTIGESSEKDVLDIIKEKK